MRVWRCAAAIMVPGQWPDTICAPKGSEYKENTGPLPFFGQSAVNCILPRLLGVCGRLPCLAEALGLGFKAELPSEEVTDQFCRWLGATLSEYKVTVFACRFDIAQSLFLEPGKQVGSNRERPLVGIING